MTKTIRIACETSRALSIDNMIPFQKDLKDLTESAYQQLRGEIENTGFAFPIFIWNDDGKNYVVGGHQRLRTLQKMRDDGWDVPHIPIVLIEAKDRKEAKRRVIQDLAQFGEVSRDGAYEFMHDSGITIDDLSSSFRIPDINMKEFRVEYFDNPVTGNCDEDEVPSLIEPKTKIGDIYQMGDHRLMCGDSTVITDIEKLIKSGEIVYEPFSGSGSGFIAAEKEKVMCFGMELSPHYCDIIVARWQNFTGKKAELLES